MQPSSLDTLERDRSLHDPARWRERLDALDRLELCLLEGGDRLRIERLQAQLDAANAAFYRQLRERIQRGDGAAALSGCVRELDDLADEQMSADGYDHLDELVSGLLQLEAPDDATIEQPPEMVFYQPTPARHVFDLIRRLDLGADDVLMDLGSGLGHVPLLAAICSDARCIGVEREAAYVACCRRSADALRLPRVDCLQQDARDADFSRASVFYLYTPFTGSVMRAVLDSLRAEAARRPIRVASYGPCTPTIAGEAWLQPIGGVDVHRVALFASRD